MNQQTCITHGPITGFETRTVWTFTEVGAVEGVPSVVLSCGCTHEGVRAPAVELEDGSGQLFTLTYYTGEPIISFVCRYAD